MIVSIAGVSEVSRFTSASSFVVLSSSSAEPSCLAFSWLAFSSRAFSSASARQSSRIEVRAVGASNFLLLPRGAGSNGVRQYVTVLVTTWRTLTLPGLPFASGLASLGEYVALQGAALSGVPEYGVECAELSAGVKGD